MSAAANAGRIGRRVVAAMPVVPAARREALARAEPPSGAAAHARLLEAMPFLDAVEVAPPPAPRAPGVPARVLAWNLERGRDVEGAARALAAARADVMLLTELDHGMARSGQEHVARALAARLGCGHAFAVEFLELGLGAPAERAALPADARNAVGHHGAAILARAPLLRPAVVRLGDDGAWLDGARGERRVGGRIALLAQVALGGRPVTFAAVHLESHGDPAQRAAQLGVLLSALDAYDARAPVVIGGDLNTLSLGVADLADRERLAARLREDPERWRHPERHEPLFAAAEAAGYDWRACNALGEPTHRHPDPAARPEAGAARPGVRGALKLDWFLARGVRARAPRVLDAVDPASGAALSDHEAIVVEVA